MVSADGASEVALATFLEPELILLGAMRVISIGEDEVLRGELIENQQKREFSFLELSKVKESNDS